MAEADVSTSALAAKLTAWTARTATAQCGSAGFYMALSDAGDTPASTRAAHYLTPERPEKPEERELPVPRCPNCGDPKIRTPAKGPFGEPAWRWLCPNCEL